MVRSPSKFRFPKGRKGARGRELDQLPPSALVGSGLPGGQSHCATEHGVDEHSPQQHLSSCPLLGREATDHPCPPHPGTSREPGLEPGSTPWAEVQSSHTHSWFSILCISSLILMAVVSSSSSSSGFREASLSDSEVSSSLTCLRSRFRPTEAGTLTGDKCRDYRNEAGSEVRSRWLGGDGGERNGGGTERKGKRERQKERKEEKREREREREMGSL